LWEYQINLNSAAIWNDSAKILPFLKEWIKVQRWAGLASISDFELLKMDEFCLYNTPSSKILGLLVKLQPIQEQKILFTYFIPIEITRYSKPVESTIKLKCLDEDLILTPAELSRQFFESTLEYIAQGKEIQSTHSNQTYFQRYLSDFNRIKIKSMKILGDGGTTNTLFKIIWSDDSKGVCKIFRILSINPEVKMLSSLYANGFHNVPRPLGSVSMKIEDRDFPLILFSEFIESIGDGGTHFWTNINDQMKKWDKNVPIESDPLISYCRNLGEIVSDFHYHSSIIQDDFFRPAPISREDVSKWKSHLKELFNSTKKQLTTIFLSEGTAQSISAILERFLKSYLKIDFWNTLIGAMKIKIHQDLHLSQMLTNPSSGGIRFTIIDFEGDPLLPPEEKFKKDPIFRDLAAICSAFHYIKYNALKGFSEQNLNISSQNFADAYLELCHPSENNLISKNSRLILLIKLAREWEKRCQDWFIDNYIHQSNAHQLALNLDFTDRTTFQGFLYIFRIERLIKELYYESLFRKTNAIIPLIGLLENSTA